VIWFTFKSIEILGKSREKNDIEDTRVKFSNGTLMAFMEKFSLRGNFRENTMESNVFLNLKVEGLVIRYPTQEVEKIIFFLIFMFRGK